jgi:hypothetical protein
MRTIAAALGAGLLGLAGAAWAETLQLGVFRDWSAFEVRERGAKECFIYSKPVQSQGKYTKRGEVFAQVTHRPQEGVRDEVSFTAGYTLRPQSSVAVEIDGKKFSLFVHEDRAYAPDASADRALAQAMQAGKSMLVRGVSAHGTSTTDRYSLAGFAAARQAMERACRRK